MYLFFLFSGCKGRHYLLQVKSKNALHGFSALGWRNNRGKMPFDVIFFLHLQMCLTKNNKIMVKHIILWTLNPELSEEEKASVKKGIKEGLEGLVGKVPGLLEVKVNIDGRLASSNADVMLDSTLESEEALKGYAVHPEHVAVANGKVRPYTVQRSCLDFEI